MTPREAVQILHGTVAAGQQKTDRSHWGTLSLKPYLRNDLVSSSYRPKHKVRHNACYLDALDRWATMLPLIAAYP
jgi:hypothetical protein